jgi:hypothetical protein
MGARDRDIRDDEGNGGGEDVGRLLGGCCTFSMVAMNAIWWRKKETIEDCWMDVPGREAVL